MDVVMFASRIALGLWLLARLPRLSTVVGIAPSIAR